MAGSGPAGPLAGSPRHCGTGRNIRAKVAFAQHQRTAVRPLQSGPRGQGRTGMHSLFYIIGVVVVALVVINLIA